MPTWNTNLGRKLKIASYSAQKNVNSKKYTEATGKNLSRRGYNKTLKRKGSIKIKMDNFWNAVPQNAVCRANPWEAHQAA